MENTDAEVEEALNLMGTGKTALKHRITTIGDALFDPEPPKKVIERFGPVSTKPSTSIGISTFARNWGPTNLFSTWIAKLFSSAIRDEVLLKVSE